MPSDFCVVCGSPLTLYCKENYDLHALDSFAYASRKLPEYMHFRLLECPRCHLLFSLCPIEDKTIFDSYRSAEYDSGKEADMVSATYLYYLMKYFPDFPRESALDIGTGNGSYLLKLQSVGVKRVIGIEPSEAPIRAADPSIRDYIINDVFSPHIVGGESFSMISMFMTIEHIPNSLKILREIRDCLSDDGLFYVVCHDYRSLVNRILGTRSPIYDIEHLQIMSKRGIVCLLEKCGFGVRKVFSLWNRYPLHYWARLFPLPNSIKQKFLPHFACSRLGKIIIPLNVGNIGVIAKKN